MKAGIEHLQDKLECVREEVGGQVIQMGDETVSSSSSHGRNSSRRRCPVEEQDLEVDTEDGHRA